MKERKKHLRYFLYSAVLFLFCFQTAISQPTCGAHFSPWDACERNIQSKEFVFLGRVTAISEKTGDRFNDPLKITVEIENQLKGSLATRTEIYLEQRCFGRVALDGRYIFTAAPVENEKISGLYSERWSEPLDDKYSEDDVKEILAEIRAVVKNIKQPRLFGTIVEDKSGGRGRYLIASKGLKKLFAPDYLLPMANVAVIAKREADGQIFKTVSDERGKFVFADLPSGRYEVFPSLAKEYNVMSGGFFDVSKDGNGIVQIYDTVCGAHVIFNAQKQGAINLRVENAASDWAYIILHLWRVERIDGKDVASEFFYDAAPKRKNDSSGSLNYDFDYLFKNIPTGKYLLMLSITADTSQPERRVYFPGTSVEKKASVINVEAGKISDLEINLLGESE